MTTDAASLDSEFRQRVVDVMRTILANLLDYTDPVTEDMHLMHELGLSSSLGLELLLQLEDRLEIFIDVEKMNQDKVSTVGEFATYIVNHSRPA